MDFNKVDYNKKNNDCILSARKKIANENNRCLLCGKEVGSFCASHSIPINILDKMNLTNGELISFKNAVRKNILSKITQGKKNSSIFKNICRDCDQRFFSKLDNMNVVEDEWTNELLRLQSIRILLYSIYEIKEFTYSYFEMEKDTYEKKFIEEQVKLDLEDCDFYLKKYKEKLSSSEKFLVLYSETLDYEIDFITTSLLHIDVLPSLDKIIIKGDEDIIKLETYEVGDKVFNIIKLSKDREAGSDVYFLAYPYNGKTKIILFSDEKSIVGILLEEEFKKMSNNEILNYISATLVIHGKNIYGNEKFMNKFRECCKFFQFVRRNRKENERILPLKIDDIMELYSILMNDKYCLFNK